MTTVGRPASELAAAVRARELDATEVVREHLDQLAEVEHRLGAFVSTRRRGALDDAAAVDAAPDRGDLPLAGVPVAVEDVVDVAGETTRHGSRATSAIPADHDDPVVANLRAAGAILTGKTRCSELSLWGTSDDPEGVAVSPWDPTRSAGGSSGGSAAAVAAGVVPLALGADALGSIRHPAAACGLFGMKPGAGWLEASPPGRQRWFGMCRYGPLATTVADARLAMDVMAGGTALGARAGLDRPLQVAVSWRPGAPGIVVAGAWREAAIEAGRLLHRAGHTVLPEDPPLDRSAVRAILARWTQAVTVDVAGLDLDVERLQARTRGHLAAGERLARLSPVEEGEPAGWREDVDAFFAEHDVLITPTLARAQPAATTWHTRPWAANLASNVSTYPFTPPWNLADLPAVAVPLWQDGGRPLSVQVVGGPGREGLVLAVAELLEQQVPWVRHAVGWGVPTG
jgi:amidase